MLIYFPDDMMTLHRHIAIDLKLLNDQEQSIERTIEEQTREIIAKRQVIELSCL